MTARVGVSALLVTGTERRRDQHRPSGAGNKTQTAKALEIGLQTLHRKLKAYGVK